MNNQAGKYIIVFGIVIITIGAILYLFPGAFKWFGRLPGDIRIEKENYRFYFPIVSMILLSLLLTIVANILRRL